MTLLQQLIKLASLGAVISWTLPPGSPRSESRLSKLFPPEGIIFKQFYVGLSGKKKQKRKGVINLCIILIKAAALKQRQDLYGLIFEAL